jgi:4-hydroxy-3-polyprenylbenzoate decarboxylase
MELVVGISGASGTIYGIRFLEVLKEKGIRVHLLISEVAREIIREENHLGQEELVKKADYWYDIDDLTASICSGSYKNDGMVIVPCSMKTLAAIVNGFASNAMTRAADVTIKEKRPLVLVPRETPLNAIHLSNMLKLAKLDVIILPAMPGFYHQPETISDLTDFIVGKILDSLNIDHDLYRRWGS